MNSCALTIFAVQPLYFADPVSNIHYSDEIDAEPQAVHAADMPAWQQELEVLYPNRHFVCTRLAGSERVVVDDVVFDLQAHLFANTVLRQNIVVFELAAALVSPESLSEERIRSCLTRPDDPSRDVRLPAVRACLEEAERIIAAGGSNHDKAVCVENDTCNIALFWDPQDSTQPDGERSGAHLFSSGSGERISAGRDHIDVSAVTDVFFGGRVHHVWSTSRSDVAVIKQILLMLQTMWFYVLLYLRFASRWHRRILVSSRHGNLKELEWNARRMIHVFQVVQLQNTFAKHAYGVLCDRIYEPCQRRWGVERSIEHLGRYSTFFGDFIREYRDRQSRKSELILNYALSILGILGVVGLWSDILQAQVSARSIGTFGRLFDLSDTNLGIVTIIVFMLALLASVGIVVWGISVWRGWGRRR